MKKEYVVRVVQTDSKEGGEISDTFLESLRYAGLIALHEVDMRGLTVTCFDIICAPTAKNSEQWAKFNAERMRTFGFNAVAAPRGDI